MDMETKSEFDKIKELNTKETEKIIGALDYLTGWVENIDKRLSSIERTIASGVKPNTKKNKSPTLRIHY